MAYPNLIIIVFPFKGVRTVFSQYDQITSIFHQIKEEKMPFIPRKIGVSIIAHNKFWYQCADEKQLVQIYILWWLHSVLSCKYLLLSVNISKNLAGYVSAILQKIIVGQQDKIFFKANNMQRIQTFLNSGVISKITLGGSIIIFYKICEWKLYKKTNLLSDIISSRFFFLKQDPIF
ncbi:hypothetical protein ACJX0J_030190 [Zea mays]